MIFHYGGHASGDGLFLESAGLEGAVAHAEGLATFLGQRRNLELVFLNGCSTRAQAAGLLEAGVSAVIATARAIEDTVALEFAAAFYSELAAGATLRAAYEAARGRVLASRGSARSAYFRTRDLVATTAPPPRTGPTPPTTTASPGSCGWPRGPSWNGAWSLPEAVGDPLFGLPTPLVDSCPNPPTWGLQRFTRDEAAVFFGRGKAIRELYNLVTDPGTRPVILYYGPTGVGKSSVLDAGLLPPPGASTTRSDISAAIPIWACWARCAPGLGTGDAANEPRLRASPQLWLECERPDRPLVVILDQAEEAFTDPRAAASTSAEDHAPDREEPSRGRRGARRDLWPACARPSGSGPRATAPGQAHPQFRNEWLDRFEQAFNAAKLGWEPMPLKPLDEAGIIEAIEGPARDPALDRRYQLSVSGAGLAIASDLRDRHRFGRGSHAPGPADQHVGPCRGKRNAGVRSRHVQGPPAGGIPARGHAREGLEAVVARRTGSSGLCSTSWNSIRRSSTPPRSGAVPSWRRGIRTGRGAPRRCSCARGEVSPDRHRGQRGRLGESPSREPAGPRHAGPPGADGFLDSAAPGQRARRLLENRAREWEDGGCGHSLDGTDLTTVESGAAGMRSWTADDTPGRGQPPGRGGPPRERTREEGAAAQGRGRDAARDTAAAQAEDDLHVGLRPGRLRPGGDLVHPGSERRA